MSDYAAHANKRYLQDKWRVVRLSDRETFHIGDEVERWGVIESFYTNQVYMYAITNNGKKRMRVPVRELNHV